MQKKSAAAFGLIIVGSEILDGRIRDSHFEATRELLHARSLRLRYVQVLPDDPRVIEEQLRWAMANPEPFFCCGGIGSTPDDHTRGCAARVAGVGLALHPEGVAILREVFRERATPARMKLVEFPEGCTLVPNPYNRIPGFAIGNGFFLPGFPQMARPMTEWILDTLFERGAELSAASVLLPGAREADLVALMEAFIADHPSVSFSSLPEFVEGGTQVRLGLSGLVADVETGMAGLRAMLDKAGIGYEAASPGARPA